MMVMMVVVVVVAVVVVVSLFGGAWRQQQGLFLNLPCLLAWLTGLEEPWVSLLGAGTESVLMLP